MKIKKHILTALQVTVFLLWIAYGWYTESAREFDNILIPDLGDMLAFGLMAFGIVGLQRLKGDGADQFEL